MTEYSIFDAAKIIGRDHTAIREWFKRGFIKLEGWQKARGRGTKTVLKIENVYRLKLIDTLMKAGITGSFAANTMPDDSQWESWYVHVAITEGGGQIAAVDKNPTPNFSGDNYRKNDGSKVYFDDALIFITINLKNIKNSVDRAR